MNVAAGGCCRHVLVLLCPLLHLGWIGRVASDQKSVIGAFVLATFQGITGRRRGDTTQMLKHPSGNIDVARFKATRR